MKKIVKSKPFSLGFIGGALNSAVGYAHFVSCLMDNQWTLDAGCFSNDAQLNWKTAYTYGVSVDRVYDKWPEMLFQEKGRLDAIVILTPTPLHYEIVIDCLNEEFPVICEKALTISSAEAEKIIETRTRKNSFLAVTYNYSGYPMVRELRNIIEKGMLGQVIHFQAEMPQEGFIRLDEQGNKPIPQSWRLSDGRVPTIHLDLAVHLHHLIYYLIRQRPVEVVSDQKSFGWFSEVVDNVTCLCRYEKGIQGQMWFSKSALGHRNGLRLRIYGTKAAAEWFQACPEELVLSYQDGRREILDRASKVQVSNLRRYSRFKAGHPAGFIEAFANLYFDFAICLQQYKETGKWQSEDVFSAELAVEGLYLFEAMVASVESKGWKAVRS